MSAIMYELWDTENDEPAGSGWYASRADAERERATFDYPEVVEVRPVGPGEDEPCEVCGSTLGVRAWGMDASLLCGVHFAEADRNYEAAVRALNPSR